MFDVSSTSDGADVSGGSSPPKRQSFKARSAERRREVQAKLYYERKEAGLCTRCGVPAVDGGQMCEPCLERHREATNAACARLREARREAGVCGHCGKVRTGDEYACLACRLARGEVSTGPAIIAAIRTDSDPRFRVGEDGRRRFHGQMRRGRQPASQIDDQDLELAIAQLTKARDHLRAIAASPEIAKLPKYQRDAAKREAFAMAEHGARFVEDLLDRNQFGAGNELRMTRVDQDENKRKGGGR
jgi:hypothetical protein